jgi:hypothetical protein
MTWRPLILIDDVLPFSYGGKSREVAVQAEREQNVLAELYFRHSLIDSPKEPDPESYEHVEPQVVPLEDVTGNPDSVTSYTDIQWPAPKGELPLAFSSNAFANVFSSINIPPAIGIPPNLGMNSSIANPLATFANAPNPMIAPPWMVPPTPFMQQPPPVMIPPPAFGNNRGGMNNNNNFNRGNNGRPFNHNNNNNGGNWVRGNTRRGTCNQFQRTGACRNKSCPYIHER